MIPEEPILEALADIRKRAGSANAIRQARKDPRDQATAGAKASAYEHAARILSDAIGRAVELKEGDDGS